MKDRKIKRQQWHRKRKKRTKLCGRNNFLISEVAIDFFKESNQILETKPQLWAPEETHLKYGHRKGVRVERD